MKFIHIADVHLGAAPDKDKPWAEERKNHSWQALAQVIATAEEEQVDLLLIAGDLFHRQPLQRELKEVNYQFSTLSHTQVVLIAGNHDFISPDSYYRTFHWAENVHFLKKETMQYVELPMLRTRVYGLSYWQRELPEALYEEINVEEGSFLNILLAHGGDEKHIPFRAENFLKMGFDYVACGHIHKPMQYVENRVVMAGALQPVDCNDTGSHGFFMGDLSEERCQVEFRPLNYCEYAVMNLKVISDITNGALEEFIKQRLAQAPEYMIFKVMLTGFYDGSAPLETERLENLERVIQVVNQCRPDYDFEQLKQQYSQQLIGKYIHAMEQLPQDEVAKLALYYGVEALMER
ncbi:metallophosphoesterase family protein [Roseburia sp. 499]|uniref:metallophosphoesterase family protein n=1 Tax=Roseburia sp. 499 TaxID=1261634 RepID=UPI000951C015|nr:DNA repair exonuclease [Roseburia sp. 499]WVK70195.1 DNA repair exonuclease [Roseburia sp. 499]